MRLLFFLLSLLSVCLAQPFAINWEFVGGTCTLTPTRVQTTNLNGTTCEQQSCTPVVDRHRFMVSRLTLCDVTSAIMPFQLVVRPYGAWALFGTRSTGGNAVVEFYNEATCSNPINLIQRYQFWEPLGNGCLPDLFIPTFWAWYECNGPLAVRVQFVANYCIGSVTRIFTQTMAPTCQPNPLVPGQFEKWFCFYPSYP